VDALEKVAVSADAGLGAKTTSNPVTGTRDKSMWARCRLPSAAITFDLSPEGLKPWIGGLTIALKGSTHMVRDGVNDLPIYLFISPGLTLFVVSAAEGIADDRTD